MKLFLALIFVGLVAADVYMHNPRGSNNRFFRNDDTNAVQNANRLFDSQNNNKGGYNVGPQNNFRDMMYYYAGSQLTIEWTAQHECSPDSVTADANCHCEMVLQYMCSEWVRDGSTTDTITNNEASNTDLSQGMHEPYSFYEACEERDRNMGLFLADRHIVDPLGRTAEYTRQNNNQDRHGFECPEERDYYPYWHPTPWRDIAILTSNVNNCPMYQAESQNVKEKHYCSEFTQFNQQGEGKCPLENWRAEPAHGIPAPDCRAAQWTRDNHLGNAADGYMAHYNWTIPSDIGTNEFCVLRLRYNISTDDYDGWTTDSTENDIEEGDMTSPVRQDPYVDYGWMGQYLSLALNTNQYGRTFQDRSHSFAVKPVPSGATCNNIYNVNVRGKRGNIVQAYPAVQYDFTPNRLHVEVGDCVHFQWTGSDRNANDNTQTGEGSQRTDRSNICQIESPLHNKCMELDQVTMFSQADALRFAFIDQQGCRSLPQLLQDHQNVAEANRKTEVDRDTSNCGKLNAAPNPYFDGGLVSFDTPGEFYYMSTRNNNFGWQTQKATVVVTDPNAQ